MDVAEAKSQLEGLRSIFHKETAMRDRLKSVRKEKEEDVKTLLADREQIELKKILVSEAAVEARKQARDVLQSIGTRALQFIMGDHMSLEIELKEQAKQWVANFITKTEESEDYLIETDPAEEEGGGVADVVSLSTQTAMLQLTGESNVAPIFLDEPSKYVSKGHSEQVAKFLREISSHYNRQVFMVTHDEYLANIGDVAYSFVKVEGSTVATKLVA